MKPDHVSVSVAYGVLLTTLAMAFGRHPTVAIVLGGLSTLLMYACFWVMDV